MSRVLALGLVMALACGAHAGGNPDIRIYIDFDPPNYVHEVTPELYTTIEAHVCLDMIDEGFSCVSFRMNNPSVDCPGTMAPPSWVFNFMPPP